jgi:predicted phosphate transport protein (TIGR00153 family)
MPSKNLKGAFCYSLYLAKEVIREGKSQERNTMQTLARLFGRSPFAPLRTHMAKVASCVHTIVPLFEALKQRDYDLVNTVAERISKLEHDADVTKNDIRNHLPTGVFMPVARAPLLEILSLQDNLADHAEDTAILLTFRQIVIEPVFQNELEQFLKKNLDAFNGVYLIIQEMEELLESSFGGPEAEKVKKMVEKVAFLEHEADLLQRQLVKILFGKCEEMSPPTFYLWMKIIHEIASLSDESEKLANRVRMTLEVK